MVPWRVSIRLGQACHQTTPLAACPSDPPTALTAGLPDEGRWRPLPAPGLRRYTRAALEDAMAWSARSGRNDLDSVIQNRWTSRSPAEGGRRSDEGKPTALASRRWCRNTRARLRGVTTFQNDQVAHGTSLGVGGAGVSRRGVSGALRRTALSVSSIHLGSLQDRGFAGGAGQHGRMSGARRSPRPSM